MVERVTGCPQDMFLKVAETILANSGRDRTTASATPWPGPSTPTARRSSAAAHCSSCCSATSAGRAAASWRCAATPRSRARPTCRRCITPSTATCRRPPGSSTTHAAGLPGDRGRGHRLLGQQAEVPRLLPQVDVRATPPRRRTTSATTGTRRSPATTRTCRCSWPWPTARCKGMLCIGQNPATSLNAGLQRKGLRQLKWLVVKDNFLTETATFWNRAPEVEAGEVRPEDIETEVFFFPSAQVAETDGSFTNTQRLLQWHDKAAESAGRVPLRHVVHPPARHAAEADVRRQRPRRATRGSSAWRGTSTPTRDTRRLSRASRTCCKILREINGYVTGDPSSTWRASTSCKDDGSTTCASWIYCGVFPAPDRNLAARNEPDPPADRRAHRNWGWAWPANRGSSTTAPRPTSRGAVERAKEVGLVGRAASGRGTTCPTSRSRRRRTRRGKAGGIGLDAHSGTEPFMMKPDGRAGSTTPRAWSTGRCRRTTSRRSRRCEPALPAAVQPGAQVLEARRQPARRGRRPAFPYVITTYRLTEHHLSGAMSRWNPWLAELQPELFIELSPGAGGGEGDREHRRGCGSARRAPRSGPRRWSRAGCGRSGMGNQMVHQVGMPWHWGYEGVATGDVVNDLTALVGDPNVTIHEGKAFVCNVEKARMTEPMGFYHRHDGVHRVQGVRGRLQGVEPASRHRRRRATS